MKDSDIIKALEWCEQFENNIALCGNFGEKHRRALQVMQLIKLVLKDYTRQKAEIEKKDKQIEELVSFQRFCEEKAIKDFIAEFERRCIDGGIYPAFVKRQLEHVKEEMVGE